MVALGQSNGGYGWAEIGHNNRPAKLMRGVGNGAGQHVAVSQVDMPVIRAADNQPLFNIFCQQECAFGSVNAQSTTLAIGELLARPVQISSGKHEHRERNKQQRCARKQRKILKL